MIVQTETIAILNPSDTISIQNHFDFDKISINLMSEGDKISITFLPCHIPQLQLLIDKLNVIKANTKPAASRIDADFDRAIDKVLDEALGDPDF